MINLMRFRKLQRRHWNNWGKSRNFTQHLEKTLTMLTHDYDSFENYRVCNDFWNHDKFFLWMEILEENSEAENSMLHNLCTGVSEKSYFVTPNLFQGLSTCWFYRMLKQSWNKFRTKGSPGLKIHQYGVLFHFHTFSEISNKLRYIWDYHLYF